MKLNNLDLDPNAKISNLRVETGPTFPPSPNLGRIYFLTAFVEPNYDPGLYVWNSISWVTGDVTGIVAGEGLTGGGTAGSISLAVDFSVVATRAYVNNLAAGGVTAGDGLVFNDTTLNVVTASSSRIVVDANSLDLAVTNVSAGEYTKLTVDAYGRAVGGTSLTSSDIPSLSWNKITTDKPTTLAGYGITDAATVGGSLSQNFLTASLTVAGDVLPSANGTLNLGSASYRFAAIYVNDLHLSGNTLYLGDTPVLGTNQNTIEIKADPDQSLLVKTSGLGVSYVSSEKGVQVSTSGLNADVLIQSTGTGGKTRFGSNTSIELTSPVLTIYSDVTTSASLTVGGNLTLTGNLTVNGSSSIIHSTTVTTADNIIVLNSGEVGEGVTAGKAGLQVDRGSLADYQLVFDEVDDIFKVGPIGSLEALASQAWASSSFSSSSHVHAFSSLTSKPTTLAGYGITDAAPLSHVSDTTIHVTSSQRTWLDSVTTSSSEINYLTGVGSNVQSQLNGKQPLHANLTSVANLSTSSTGLVHLSNGVASLDTSSYLTANQTITFSGDASGSGNTSVALTLATVPIAKGGTGQTSQAAAFDALSPITSLGDLIYGSGSYAAARLAGNVSSTKQFLAQVGNGSASAAPYWSNVSKADVGLGNVENTALSSWAGTTNLTSLGTVTSGSWAGTAITTSYGGTGLTSLGSNNQLLGVNNAGTGLEYKTLNGTTDQVNVTLAAASVTLSLPQSLATTSSPTFAAVTVSAAPTSASQLANKQYVDDLASGLTLYKQACLTATTANINLNAAPNVLDGVTLAANDRILVKDQATANKNGIYYVQTLGTGSNGVWARASDADNTPVAGEVKTGMYTFVTSGTVNANTAWVLNTPGTITLDSTSLTFVLFLTTPSLAAGSGLSQAGNVLSVGTASSSRIVVNADNLDLASVVTAGSGNNITFDTYGRVTGSSTVAYLTSEVDTLATVTSRGATTATALSVTNTTTSSGSGSGALVVSGGVGIGGTLNVTGSISTASTVYSITSAGQNFFIANQAGSTYAYPGAMFKAIADNNTGSANYFFEGYRGGVSGTRSFLVRADGYIQTEGNVQAANLYPGTTQTNFNTVKAPGLYQYDNGLSNTPNGAGNLNWRTIEIGSTNRYTQIALPWDSQEMYFRNDTGSWSSTWARVWTQLNDGANSGLDADLLDGLHAFQLFNNMGNGHTTYGGANAVADFGFHFIQNGTGNPSTGATQYYTLEQGLGSEYNYTQYVNQFALARVGSGTDPGYLLFRQREGGTWGSWTKIYSGQADTAISATTATDAYHLIAADTGVAINTSFTNTPVNRKRYSGEISSGGPAGSWWFIENMRHSNNVSYWGRQNAWGWEDNANEFYSRNVANGTWGSWVRFLNSNNYNSYSPTLTGGGASGTWSISVSGSASQWGGQSLPSLVSGQFLTNNGSTLSWAAVAAVSTFYNNASPYNVGINSASGIAAGTGTFNTTLGYQALYSNTTGNNNAALGSYALFSNTIGSSNTAVGSNALYSNTTGAHNTAIGYAALNSNLIGTNNVAVGEGALNSNTSNYNVAVGNGTLYTNTTGINNVAIGYQTLFYNVSGNNSVGIGYQTLFNNTTGVDNVGIGHSALYTNSVGVNNTAVGYQALYNNTTGNVNTAVGASALFNNSTGSNNTAVGVSALYNNTVGIFNTALGQYAIYVNSSGTNNTGIGYNALSSNSTGIQNTALGSAAGGTITTGYNNTCIGYNAQAASATTFNTITLGDANIATLRCNKTTITALSDERDKTDIVPLDIGLSFIEKVQTVKYKWDRRDWYDNGIPDGSKKDTKQSFGIIAQQLKTIQDEYNASWLDLVYDDNPEKLEATPGNLLIPLIKAVQELSAKVKELETRLNNL